MKLNAALNLLDDRIEDADLERTFVADLFEQWRHQHDEILELAADFEFEMSPAVLLDQPPLVHCDQRTREWLRRLVHELWLAREPVKDWIWEVQCLLGKADTSYQELESALRAQCADTHSASALRLFYSHFRQWRDSCQKLANAISRFPNSIKIA